MICRTRVSRAYTRNMRRVAILCVLVGCGRLGFEDSRAHDDAPPATADAPRVVDAGLDAPADLPGLIARWAFDDDPASGTLADTGGGGHDATCTSCPTRVPGHLGNAARFDGSQFARVGYGTWLDTPTAYSYAVWIQIDVLADQVAFGRPYAAGALDAWDLVAWSDGTGTCLETVDATTNRASDCGPMLTLGVWHHVAARWTGATTAVFVDGVKAVETTRPTSQLDNHDLILGADENNGAPMYFWHGRLDELQLYDRALTDAEIGELAAH